MPLIIDKIIDAIKCSNCKERLKSPVLMPCGHSICNHHVKEPPILCIKCNAFFGIPLNGFPIDKSLEILLELNIEYINLGKDYFSISDNCKLFGDLLDRFDKIKNDPETRIKEEISEIKNKVDLRREELKQEIDKESLEMIEKLDDFEKDCIASIKSDPKLNKKLEKWKDSLKQWERSLSALENDAERRKAVLNESTSTLKDLHSELLSFDKMLFLNRLNKFKYPNEFAYNGSITLKFEVKELSKYKDMKEFKDFVSPSVNIDGIDLRIKLTIKHLTTMIDNVITNKKENYVGVFLQALQNPRIRKFYVDYDLVILDQFGMNNSVINKFEDKFDTISYDYGYPKFIKLKDLIDNSYLYNAQNDSCTVQAIINKIEWD